MNKIRIISLQISEEFVKEYNEATAERKAQLDYQCMQIYEKLKVNTRSLLHQIDFSPIDCLMK